MRFSFAFSPDDKRYGDFTPTIIRSTKIQHRGSTKVPVNDLTGALISASCRVLALLPVISVVWGFIEWAENPHRPNFREIRQYLIAIGLGAAGIPSLVFVGLISEPKTAPLGSWDNYPISSALGFWNLPLGVFSLILGLVGKGKGRSLLLVGAGFLVLVWSMAFRHW